MAGYAFDASAQVLEQYTFDPDRLVAGQPTLARKRFWESADASSVHGIWEMTAGTIERFDGDETFVVVSGKGEIIFTASGERGDLVPGTVVVMKRGEPVTISISETLRKVYVIQRGPTGA